MAKTVGKLEADQQSMAKTVDGLRSDVAAIKAGQQSMAKTVGKLEADQQSMARPWASLKPASRAWPRP